MKKTLIIIGSIVVAVVIIVASINSINRKESNRVANEEYMRQVRIDNCIDNAYDVYIMNWNSACKLEGKGDDCSLPIWRKEMLDSTKKEDEDRCIERYAK